MDKGELLAVDHARADLANRRMRVLHEQSFIDDPTRLLRLARYVARLGFAVEQRTAELAAEARAAGAVATVSGARIGAELRLSLAEPDPLAVLAELDRLQLLGVLDPGLRFDDGLLRAALELLAPDGDLDPAQLEVLALAALALPLVLAAGRGPADRSSDTRIRGLLDRLEFPASTRDRVASAAASVPRLIDELPAAANPSQLLAIAERVPPEGVALAGAASEPALGAARRWLTEVRHVHLRINGDDLIAAGIPEGPELGRRLENTLRKRVDGELADERAAQLRAALEEA
jgi:tRNA nucleotidyltransferase (CCA-adding enzyme)